MKYSTYQEQIFDFVANGKGHGEVIARAGSGKTFSAVHATKYIPRGMGQTKTVFLAFNKHIQVELQETLGDRAEARTYHSFGLSAIQGHPKITGYKNDDILVAHMGKDLKPLFPIISKVVGLFKGNLMVDVTPQTVNQIIDQYGVELGDETTGLFDEIVEGVKICMNPDHVERLGKIDYDDMIWYPLVRNLPIRSVDYLLVDEFQDSNVAQMELVMRAKNSHGRVLAIGDDRQAIYYWRGAGSDGMAEFAKRTTATILPLTISYRCPKAVVQYVNKTFPDITFEAWDEAIEGSVNSVTEEMMFKYVLPGDMVLCRTNAPLVRPAMRLLREGKKAIIKGRDIGKNLITLIRQIQNKFGASSLNEFLQDLDDYVARETLKLRETNRFNQADLLEDKQETIYAFADGVDSVGEMVENIERIFSDDIEGIVFSSGHRSKGLEAPNVYILNPELLGSTKRCKTVESAKQEINLHYVMATRAKQSLNFVVGR